MQTHEKEPLTLMPPKSMKQQLRRIAAERNIEDPDQYSTMSSVGVEFLGAQIETYLNDRRKGNGTGS